MKSFLILQFCFTKFKGEFQKNSTKKRKNMNILWNENFLFSDVTTSGTLKPWESTKKVLVGHRPPPLAAPRPPPQQNRPSRLWPRPPRRRPAATRPGTTAACSTSGRPTGSGGPGMAGSRWPRTWETSRLTRRAMQTPMMGRMIRTMQKNRYTLAILSKFGALSFRKKLFLNIYFG